MKHSIKMNDFRSHCHRGAITTLHQHEPGNFFFIVTNFEADQNEIDDPIHNDRPYLSSYTLKFSEVTTFDSEPTPALSTSSNAKSVTEDYDFMDVLDIYTKSIPTNQFKVKAKIKSVQHKILKIPPFEDYLL